MPIHGPHIPYKEWFAQPAPDPAHDQMNWLEVERWAARLDEQVGKGGISGFTMTWGVPGLIYVQSSATFTVPIAAALTSIIVAFSTTPTGGTHTLRIFKDNAEIWNANVPAATNPWAVTPLPVDSSLANSSRYQIRCTSVGTGSPTDMSVQIRWG